MPRYFMISVLLLALVFAAPVYAADKSSGDNTAMHLSCFSLVSPAAAKLSAKPPAKIRKGWVAQSSCDAMCAAQGAACVGSGLVGSMDQCAGVAPDVSACRCCAIGK